MYSSVYLSRRTSKIHYWEYNEKGKKCYKSCPAPMYFYMKSEEGEYTSIYGDKLKKVEFDSYEKYKSSKEMFKTSGHELFESDVSIENRFILDNYSKEKVNIPKYDIYFIDIEVHSEEGFPLPEKADHPITIITIYSTAQNKYFIFSEKLFDTKFLPENAEVNFYNGDEQKLLIGFIEFIRKSHPDVLSGWNCMPFDIPYIINRGYKLLGEEITNSLSPIKQIRKETRKTRWGLPYEIYKIMGINIIDYLELYRKYEAGERESYKLDFIAELELEKGKIKYEGSLKELYHNDWQKYCEYNFVDVQLLVELDRVKQFFNILFTVCCNCRVPFEQYDKTVRVLDGAFISKLGKNKIILPDAKEVDETAEKFEGAFVFDTISGAYDWVVSFDATSLYPSVMLLHNISPETKVLVINPISVSKVCDMLDGKEISEQEQNSMAYEDKSVKEMSELIREKNYSISSNGVVYRHDKQGVVSSFIAEWFEKRQYHKKLMKKAKEAGNHEEMVKQDGLQYNYKILLNSTYGYVGTRYSRMFDLHNAEAVTKTGQECIKKSMDSVNDFFQNKWENSKVGMKVNAKKTGNLVICGDTDSISHDSIITYGENKYTIKDFFNKLYKEQFNNYKIGVNYREFIFPENIELPYYDEKTKNIKLGKVQYIEKHITSKKMYKIKTKSGKYIKVTEDHSVMVLKDGKLIEKKPTELMKTDKIITIKTLDSYK